MCYSWSLSFSKHELLCFDGKQTAESHVQNLKPSSHPLTTGRSALVLVLVLVCFFCNGAESLPWLHCFREVWVRDPNTSIHVPQVSPELHENHILVGERGAQHAQPRRQGCLTSLMETLSVVAITSSTVTSSGFLRFLTKTMSRWLLTAGTQAGVICCGENG